MMALSVEEVLSRGLGRERELESPRNSQVLEMNLYHGKCHHDSQVQQTVLSTPSITRKLADKHQHPLSGLDNLLLVTTVRHAITL